VRGTADDSEKIWAATILDVVKKYWHQWYVFEPLLTRLPRAESDISE
jgi:hypothetical protein